MLLLLQNVLYCLLYASLIKCAVRNDGRNCLYFYPKEYIEEAQNLCQYFGHKKLNSPPA